MKDTTAIIGDIHGCLEALEEILAIATKRAETLVFLGDYINRGENSSCVLDRLASLRVERPHTVFLRGNHEADFESYLNGDRSGQFFRIGGAKTLASYADGIDGESIDDHRTIIPLRHRTFLQSLQNRYETDELVATHSPADGGPWIAGRFHISGHVPRTSREPLVTDRAAWIDTGCGTWPGAPLTCFFWPSRDWSQST